MKSFRGSKRSSKRKPTDERTELIDNQANNPTYGQETEGTEAEKRESTEGSALQRTSTLPEISAPPPRSPKSPRRKISEVLTMSPASRRKISESPGRRANGSLTFSYNSNTAGSPPLSPTLANRQSSDDLTKIEYEKLPFNFYTKNKWPWRDIVTLIPLLISISLFVPSFVIVVVTIIVSKKEVRVLPSHRKRKVVYCAVLLTLSIIRDVTLIIIIVCIACKVPIPSAMLGYPIFLFFWLLCLAMALLVFYIAEVKYILKYNTIKDNKSVVLKHFNYDEVKDVEFSKIEAEEKYFTDNYPLIALISTWTDEYQYVKSVLPRKKVFISFITCVVVCVARFLLVLGLEISPPSVHHIDSNATLGLNVTDSHISQMRSLKLYKPCVVVSSIISLVLSLLVSAFMMYALLWSMAILREWRYFNTNERDDKKTVINRGPQAIAMWWKIRETLNLFSSYSICWSVFIGRLLFASSVTLVVLMSIILMMLTRINMALVRRSTFISLVVDNILLYVLILLQCALYNLIQKERFSSTQALQLKKLNISYEIACFSYLAQEYAERETTVRSRNRLLRGRLALLQDLIPAIVHTDDGTCLILRVVNISTFVAGCAAIASTVYSLR